MGGSNSGRLNIMRILGVSVSTIVLIAVVVFVVRKWGGSIPGVNKIAVA